MGPSWSRSAVLPTFYLQTHLRPHLPPCGSLRYYCGYAVAWNLPLLCLTPQLPSPPPHPKYVLNSLTWFPALKSKLLFCSPSYCSVAHGYIRKAGGLLWLLIDLSTIYLIEILLFSLWHFHSSGWEIPVSAQASPTNVYIGLVGMRDRGGVQTGQNRFWTGYMWGQTVFIFQSHSQDSSAVLLINTPRLLTKNPTENSTTPWRQTRTC